MTKNFSFFAPIVLVDDLITCKPLLSETVFDEDWVVEAYGLAVHFKPDFGVSMLDAPNGVEDIVVNDANFLLPGEFGAP